MGIVLFRPQTFFCFDVLGVVFGAVLGVDVRDVLGVDVRDVLGVDVRDALGVDVGDGVTGWELQSQTKELGHEVSSPSPLLTSLRDHVRLREQACLQCATLFARTRR